MSKSLSEYVMEMNQRHPRLSLRAMALEAGLAENAVYKAVHYGTRPRPAALKALADTWGRTPAEKEQDYRRLMRLAGYFYEPASRGQTTHFEMLLARVLMMRRDERETWARDTLDILSNNDADASADEPEVEEWPSSQSAEEWPSSQSAEWPSSQSAEWPSSQSD